MKILWLKLKPLLFADFTGGITASFFIALHLVVAQMTLDDMTKIATFITAALGGIFMVFKIVYMALKIYSPKRYRGGDE